MSRAMRRPHVPKHVNEKDAVRAGQKFTVKKIAIKRTKTGPRKIRSWKQVCAKCLLLLLCFCLVFFTGRGIARTEENFRIETNNVRGLNNFQTETLDAPQCSTIDSGEVTFTLVTQFSEDRLWMMEYHCKRWGNSPISVSVLTNQTTNEVLDAIYALGCNREQLLVQTLDANDDRVSDYPVNILREMALSAVKTSHVMYVDIDFWESNDLHDILFFPSVRKALSENPKLALVIPAFQLNRQCKEYRDCPEINIPLMPLNREALVQSVTERKTTIFDPTNRGGHGSTQYDAWSRQESGELYDIPCFKSNRYEPYTAFRYCRDLPPFQKQFSGYGKNKMAWVMHLRRVGYSFAQLGGAFLVHYPHLDSPSRMEWNLGPKEANPLRGQDGKLYKKLPEDMAVSDWTAYKRGQVDAIFVKFRNWLQSRVQDESVTPMCEDSIDDDSRLWIDRTKDVAI